MNKLVFIALLLLSACKMNEKALIEETSGDKNVVVKLEATKKITGQPWQCELKVKAYSFKEGALKFEIFAGELNKENVHFDWKDNSNCIISITQSDNHVRTFQLLADRNQVQLGEINN